MYEKLVMCTVLRGTDCCVSRVAYRVLVKAGRSDRYLCNRDT